MHHGAEADAVGDPLRSFGQAAVGKQHEEAVRQQRNHDVLKHGLSVQRPRVLKHHAETLSRDLVLGHAGDFFALENDLAGRRAFDAHDCLHRGRFAGAVRAYQAEYFAATQIQAQISDCGETSETLGEATDLENGSGVDRGIHHERASRDRTAPRKPPGKNKTTSSATAETINVASSPVGRRNSPATIRKIAPSAAPSTCAAAAEHRGNDNIYPTATVRPFRLMTYQNKTPGVRQRGPRKTR